MIITSADCDLCVKSKELKPKAKLSQLPKNFFMLVVSQCIDDATIPYQLTTIQCCKSTPSVIKESSMSFCAVSHGLLLFILEEPTFFHQWAQRQEDYTKDC
jgi:hypothetical protein